MHIYHLELLYIQLQYRLLDYLSKRSHAVTQCRAKLITSVDQTYPTQNPIDNTTYITDTSRQATAVSYMEL